MKKAMFMIYFESYQNEYYLIKFSKCIPASIDNCFDSNIFFFFLNQKENGLISIILKLEICVDQPCGSGLDSCRFQKELRGV